VYTIVSQRGTVIINLTYKNIGDEKMKKYFMFLFCLLVAVLFVSCSQKGKPSAGSSSGRTPTPQSTDNSNNSNESEVIDPNVPAQVQSSTAPANNSTNINLEEGDTIKIEDWATISNFKTEKELKQQNNFTLIIKKTNGTTQKLGPLLISEYIGGSVYKDFKEVPGITAYNKKVLFRIQFDNQRKKVYAHVLVESNQPSSALISRLSKGFELKNGKLIHY
jgi:hypothetical protein